MLDLYSQLYDTLLSRVDPERAHGMAIRLLNTAQRVPGGLAPLRLLCPALDPRLAVSVCGLNFRNPLGVAAGLDKNCEAADALFAVGFGHVEAGTVTLRPQPGNDRPRMWRVLEQRAVINALGFPSEGAELVAPRLAKLGDNGVLGLNLGKNKATALDRAADDYQALVHRLAQYADYLTINVSSPNTPGLRSLQTAEHLSELIARVAEANESVAERGSRAAPPIWVKLAPDLEDAELEAIAAAAVDAGAAGLVATNTTIARDGLGPAQKELPGGLSGAPLKARANRVARVLYRCVGQRVPIIGVGGIEDAADVITRIRSGASLVQLYTAMIYRGPALPGDILRQLSLIADRDGWSSIGELVGCDA